MDCQCCTKGSVQKGRKGCWKGSKDVILEKRRKQKIIEKMVVVSGVEKCES